MSPSVALRLGRVSNLPTVWANTLTGALLAGVGAPRSFVAPDALTLAICMIAMSAFYIGGMFLNDAFDHEVDARERPERPIPSGAVNARTVFIAGFTLLGAGVGLVGLAAEWTAAAQPGAALFSAATLCAAIIYYDSRHKNDPMAPMVMALCRSLIYVTTSFTIAGVASEAALGGAAACFCYTAGLTYVASRENLSEVGNLWPVAVIGLPVFYGLPWALAGSRESVFAIARLTAWIGYSLNFAVRTSSRSVPGAVVRLIAGMALLDAMLLVGNGFDPAALAAAAMLPLTRMFQRFVPGT